MIANLIALAQDVKLQLDLTPGLTRTYAVTRDYKSVERDERMTFEESVTLTVTQETQEGRARLTNANMLRKTTFDGLVFPTADGEKPSVRSEQRLPNGLVFQREFFSAEGVMRERQTRTLDIRFSPDPIKVGTEWSRDIPADTEVRLPAAHWAWTCSGITDKTVTVKLRFDERETQVPITSEGTLVFERASGWLESADIKVFNTVTPGDSESDPVTLFLTWKRQ